MAEDVPTPDYTLPQADVAEVPLAGEPATDKAFACDGVTYRVRLRRAEQAAAIVNTNGDAVAPFLQAFDITVTRLDEAGEVVRDANGLVVIVANTRLTIDEEALARPDFSAEDTIMRQVRHQIWRGGRIGAAPAQLSAVLAQWGDAA